MFVGRAAALPSWPSCLSSLPGEITSMDRPTNYLFSPLTSKPSLFLFANQTCYHQAQTCNSSNKTLVLSRPWPFFFFNLSPSIFLFVSLNQRQTGMSTQSTDQVPGDVVAGGSTARRRQGPRPLGRAIQESKYFASTSPHYQQYDNCTTDRREVF